MTTTDRSNTALRRYASDLLWLHVLCGKPACRRARACMRNPRSCARRYSPLIPEPARVGMVAFLTGLQQGAAENEIRAAAPLETHALDQWTACAAAALAAKARP